MRKTFLCLAALAALNGIGPAQAADHAAVLMYHRFGENRIPSTNIRLEQFDAHLAELTSGKYRVLPLAEIVEKLKKGESLPDRAVALTADDAYLSIVTEGWPRIKKAGLPFTLFVATEPVSSRVKGYMSWDDVRKLRDEGVTIGAHGHTHFSLPSLSPDAMKRDLEIAMQIFEKELGIKPALFAYPYGEWDAKSQALARSMGYSVAFGQHSGVMHSKHDFFWMPRFPMNENFGSIERVRQALNALPLPVTDVEPTDVLIKLGQTQNPPVVRFTVAPGIERLNQMVCYNSEGKTIIAKPIGERRYEMQAAAPLQPPRDRISCSVPSMEQGRFRWFGIQFTVQK